MSEKKTKKPKIFQLSVMEELVKQVPFLENHRQQLEERVRPLLGYHWNEVVQNLLFNRYVKPNAKLLARYRILLKQYRQEKKAQKKLKKQGHAAPEAAAPAAPAAPAPPIVDPAGRVDTRLTMEQSTGGASYSYETPNFISPTSAAFRNQSQQMAHMVGATLLGESTSPSSSFAMSPNAELLCNPDRLNWLLENYFTTTGSGDQPNSQVRLDEIKAANERSAAAQLKQAGSQQREFSEKLDDGSTAVKVTDEVKGVDPIRDQMEGNTPEAEKEVRLNRGLNDLDQTLIGQPHLPKTLLDRYREQAGKELFDASKEKVAQYRKDAPEALPPGRTQLMKESWLVGKDTTGGLHRFDAHDLVVVDQVPAGAQRLELRGLANGLPLLREGHEFYVNLPSNEFMCIPLDLAPAPEPVRIDRRLFEELQRQTYYKTGGR